jgi:ectoine hydroxylase-related dioxygenase (phytanoyl-CoA dioxygenase family)
LRDRIDNPEWGPWSIKAGVLSAKAPATALQQVVAVRLHLDPSTSANGPLRVLPGSHLLGVLTEWDLGAVSAAAGPEVECTISHGSALVMRPLLLHASARMTTAEPRRVLHIEYVRSLEILPGIELATA